MKTDHVAGTRAIRYRAQDAQKAEGKTADVKASADAEPSRTAAEEKPYGEFKKAVINNPEEVSKMIEESIRWREMKFYQREEGGRCMWTSLTRQPER